MKVAVIIVTYNGERWLDSCFGSLRKSSVPLTTIVVDNLSKDNTVERLLSDYPEVQVIRNDRNSGFGQANNIGIRVALEQQADYLFLLNQDAWIFEQTIAELIAVAESNAQAGIISPVHFDATEQSLDRNFERYLRDAGVSLLLSEGSENLPRQLVVPYINAAAWLLPRKTVEVVGGFDPLFFHYGEDDNYAQRAKYHNLTTLLATRARAVHDRATAVRAMNHDYGWFKNYLVIALSDINHSIAGTILRLAPLNIKMFYRLMVALVKGDRTASQNIREGYRQIFGSMAAIKKSRRTNRRPYRSWL